MTHENHPNLGKYSIHSGASGICIGYFNGLFVPAPFLERFHHLVPKHRAVFSSDPDLDDHHETPDGWPSEGEISAGMNIMVTRPGND